MPDRRTIVAWFIVVACTFEVSHCIWEDEGWREWKEIPPHLQGMYVRFAGEVKRLGPERVMLAPKTVSYRSYTEEHQDWVTANSQICGGTSNRDNVHHNVWLPDCGWGNHLEIYERPDGNVELEEFIVITRSPGNDDERLLWQGVYRRDR